MDEDEILVISTIVIVGLIFLICMIISIRDIFCVKKRQNQLQTKLIIADDII